MADAARNTDLDASSNPVWLKTSPEKGFTYKNYKNWDDSIRVELINGLVYMMASPDEWHQWVSGELFDQIREFLKGKKCTPYMAPFDVRLFYAADESDNTVVQPDIFVVCDESKTLGQKFCKGAPDFIIELISDSSGGRDLIDKRIAYEKAKVKEYWAIDMGRVHKHILVNGVYLEKIIPLNRKLQLNADTLEGCVLDFKPIVDRYSNI